MVMNLFDGITLNSTAMAQTYIIVKYLCIIVFTLITDLECE